MDIRAVDMHGKIIGAPSAIAPNHAAVGTDRSPGGEAPVTHERIEQMVELMQGYLDSMNVSLQYSFYGARGEKVAVNVINRKTGEVIREIPSREMQALQAKMGELVGMIFNDNA
jgi:uncharacterized FlaG/YvyC family protein